MIDLFWLLYKRNGPMDGLFFHLLGECTSVVYISYTTAAWDFADIYTRSPRALGVYISKIPRSHGITITYVYIIL